jgi:hypothetical protein
MLLCTREVLISKQKPAKNWAAEAFQRAFSATMTGKFGMGTVRMGVGTEGSVLTLLSMI